MSKKSKKTKPKQIDPIEAGFDAEQVLADTLCHQFQTEDADDGDLDDAFVTAFKSFSYRMFKIFKKDFVCELVTEMAQMVDEEDGKPYVCPDCQEVHGDAPVVMAEADKSKVH